MDQSVHISREDIRVDLLRQTADLQLVQLLARPNWHLLCDAPMEAHFLRSGLLRSQMTQALEHGSFLAEGFALNCSPKATLVIATRRSELAALGVMQRRDMRAMGLFRTLLPRLLAHAPPRMKMADVMASPAPAIRYAILAQPFMDADVLAGALSALGCGKPVLHLGGPQVLFARHRAAAEFEPLQWWKMLLRTQGAAGVFATTWLWPNLAALFGCLGTAETEFLLRQIGKFALLRIKRKDLLPTAVAQHLAEFRAQDANTVSPTEDILRRLEKLYADEAAMDNWLQQVGVVPLVIDYDELSATPGETALIAARHIGIKPSAATPSAQAPRPPASAQFVRLVEMARQADGQVR